MPGQEKAWIALKGFAQGPELLDQDRQSQTGVFDGIVFLPAAELAVLVVLDQAVVGVLRERQRAERVRVFLQTWQTGMQLACQAA